MTDCVASNLVFLLTEGLAVGVGFGAIGKSKAATFESARWDEILAVLIHYILVCTYTLYVQRCMCMSTHRLRFSYAHMCHVIHMCAAHKPIHSSIQTHKHMNIQQTYTIYTMTEADILTHRHRLAHMCAHAQMCVPHTITKHMYTHTCMHPRMHAHTHMHTCMHAYTLSVCLCVSLSLSEEWRKGSEEQCWLAEIVGEECMYIWTEVFGSFAYKSLWWSAVEMVFPPQ